MTSLEGKVIAVTGAASGIGLATAHLLASRGASVSLADIQKERLEEAAADIKKSATNSRVYHKVVDVSKSSEVAAWLDETIKELGALNGAANMAGVIGRSGFEPFLIRDTPDEAFDFILSVNLKGVFNCLRAELQRMGEGASIVNASSVAGLRGYPWNVTYCASKVRDLLSAYLIQLNFQSSTLSLASRGPQLGRRVLRILGSIALHRTLSESG